MNELSLALVVGYCVYAFFHFYMSLHVKNFLGSSRGFEAFLTLFVFVAMVLKFGFLLWFAATRSWTGAGILLVLSFLTSLVGTPVEILLCKYVHRDVPYLLSLIGFVALPTCGVIILRAV